jgi:hypothetical protein
MRSKFVIFRHQSSKYHLITFRLLFFVATRFKDGTNPLKKAVYIGVATASNSTSIGLWGATAIAVTTATSFDVKSGVKMGAKIAAGYLFPGTIAFQYVNGIEKALICGSTAIKYSKMAYKYSKMVASPIEAVNFIAAKTISETGVQTLLQSWRGVEESDAFWWERPEYQHLVTD